MSSSIPVTEHNVLWQISLDIHERVAGKHLIPLTGNNPKEDKGNLLILESKTLVKRPPLFRVVMLNDDYTPMDFVVDVLKSVFRMAHEDALSTMLQIHHQGAASCGIFTRDVAETKAEMAVNLAKEHEYPLQCLIEQA
jgi:ATP-dependent Clp protease adaptor protein ClpS